MPTREERKADWRFDTVYPPCFFCRHLTAVGALDLSGGWACSAFPTEIPFVILTREMPHTTVLADVQVGKDVFESKEYDAPGVKEKVTVDFDGKWSDE